MTVDKMSKKMIDAVPKMEYEEYCNKEFYSLVIIPTNRFHDSKYRIMEFVACNDKNEPMFKIVGGTDSFRIDGCGGRNELDLSQRQIRAWAMDCLPCGYFRLWSRGRITAGRPSSDFEIFWHPTSK